MTFRIPKACFHNGITSWKLIVHYGEAPELFDMENDIGETKNLAESNPEVVATMRAA